MNGDGGVLGILHNGKHPNSNFNTFNEMLTSADRMGGEESVLKAVDGIRRKLLSASRASTWKEMFG